jgi:hypothetical protein
VLLVGAAAGTHAAIVVVRIVNTMSPHFIMTRFSLSDFTCRL